MSLQRPGDPALPSRLIPIIGLIAAICACALADRALSGPAGSKSYFGSTRPPKENILRYNNGAEPEFVDPGLSVGQPDGRICKAMFEGLTENHPKTLEPVPGMAERWELADDGITYTFHLRKTEWSDGRPVTAHDFVYSWRRVLNPLTASRYASLLYYLKNGEAFNKGEITDESAVGVVAADESTLVVTLEYPTPYWIDLTSFYTYRPVPRWCIEQYGNRWTRPENVVVNGAFRLVDWKPNNRFIFDKNPTYWDAANVKLDRIIAYSVDDLNTSINMYKSGMTDWNPSGYLPVQFIPYVRDKADYRAAPYLGSYFYSMNVTDPHLSNKWLRKALTYSIDRVRLCRDLLKDSKIPLGTYAPMGFEGYPAPEGVRYDPDYARECLAKAGYPGGKGLPKLDIIFNTSEDHKKIAEVIQDMWQRELGISVELSNQEWASYLKATTQLNYRIARRSWIGDYADPNTFLATMISGDGNNRTGWSNAEYDALLAEANREQDKAERFRIMARAEAILLEELPIIPIYNYMLTELVKPYVKGLYPTLLDDHPVKDIWIDRDWQAEDHAGP